MKKSHRSLCAAALCLSFSSFLAAQSFSDEQQPKVSSAIHPWAKQEVIEDVSPDVLARLAEIRRQREQAARDSGTTNPAAPVAPDQPAIVTNSSPAMLSATIPGPAIAAPASGSTSLAFNEPL